MDRAGSVDLGIGGWTLDSQHLDALAMSGLALDAVASRWIFGLAHVSAMLEEWRESRDRRLCVTGVAVADTAALVAGDARNRDNIS